MQDMPRKLPLYVRRERTRHGKLVFYFRQGQGPRIRLPQLDDPGFETAYKAALTGQEPLPRRAYGKDSLHWLVTQYRASGAWLALSAATRRQRDQHFRQVLDTSGTYPYASLDRKHIVKAREKRKDRPDYARNFLDAFRGLFRWAIDCELIDTDPTAGVANPKRKNGVGFEAWTAEDIELYQKKWPKGTHERVWLAVLLYTGLRRGDAVRAGRQHVKNGVLTIRTEKTGTEVDIAIVPGFAAELEQGPTGDLHFIVGKSGKPLTKESFGNQFREACRAAGIRKSAHGIRKLRATMAAEAGATVSELEALFGWTGGTMAIHYTKSANRKRLARQAMDKIENVQKPHLDGQKPHLGKRS